MMSWLAAQLKVFTTEFSILKQKLETLLGFCYTQKISNIQYKSLYIYTFQIPFSEIILALRKNSIYVFESQKKNSFI